MKFGLKEKIIDEINSIFSKFSQIDGVTIFGSRAKGNYKEGSDIDLALIGQNLNLSILSRVDCLLDKLNLPYSFNVVIFSQIENADLIEHIQRAGVPFFERH